MRTKLTLVFLLSFLLTACAVNPVTKQREFSLLNRQQEIKMGETHLQPLLQSQGGPYNAHPEIQAYVEKIGKRISSVSDRPYLPFSFIVVNTSSINAAALPGGKILINRGLLTELKSEAELAAVIGHEVVHATARHSAKAIERNLLLSLFTTALASQNFEKTENKEMFGQIAAFSSHLVNQKYSRAQEFEADKYGMKYLALAGYNTHAAVTLQETFLRLSKEKKQAWLEGLLASHPPSQKRIEENRIQQENFAKYDFLGEQEYQTAMQALLETKEAYVLADQAAEIKDFSKAKRMLEQAIKQEPKEALFQGLLAKRYLEEKDYKKADKHIIKALKQNPKYYEFHLVKGVIEYEFQNFHRSQLYLEKSLALLAHPMTHYYLGKTYEKQGQYQLAKKHFATLKDQEGPLALESSKHFSSLDFKDNPSIYVHIEPTINSKEEIWYNLRANAPIALEKFKVNVVIDERVYDSFYVPELSPDKPLMVKAHLPISTKRLKNTTLYFSIHIL